VEQTVEENLDYLVRFAFYRIGRREDAEDIVHSAIEKLLTRNFSTVKGNALKMYLFRTVNNSCLDFLRHNHPMESTDGIELSDESADEAELYDEAARINSILQQLPERESEIIRMKVVSELTFTEIAAILSISPGTAATRFKLGMDKLRTIYNRLS